MTNFKIATRKSLFVKENRATTCSLRHICCETFRWDGEQQPIYYTLQHTIQTATQRKSCDASWSNHIFTETLLPPLLSVTVFCGVSAPGLLDCGPTGRGFVGRDGISLGGPPSSRLHPPHTFTPAKATASAVRSLRRCSRRSLSRASCSSAWMRNRRASIILFSSSSAACLAVSAWDWGKKEIF